MNEHLQGGAAPAAAAQPLFDPLSPDYIRDPYPSYERLRTLDPVHLTPFGNYLVSRHAEVSLVLRDKRFGKDFVERSSRRYGAQIMDEPVFQSMGHWMLQQDPPDHTRLRGLVVKAFTARRVEDMRPRIQQIVDDTLDRVEGAGHMDLIEDFAFRLPVTVICDMLGIPEDHREVFYKSSRNGGRLLDPVPLSRAEIDEANAANLLARGYFQQLFDLRRKQPGDDLTTQLVQAEEDGSKLSNEELTANIILLFGAGHETTVNLIGNGLLALFRNPDQLALLKANPALITNAVEEFLRYNSSVQMTGRVALEDIDDLGGKPVPKGETVLCLLGLRQPRSGRLSRSPRSPRHHASQCPSVVVWRRHSFLPRRATRPHRGRGRHRHPAAAPPRHPAGRRRAIRSGVRPSCCADCRSFRQAGERRIGVAFSQRSESRHLRISPQRHGRACPGHPRL